MSAPDLEAIETALTTRLLAIQNAFVTPTEFAVRSVFNLIDEAMSGDDTPHRLPGVGIIHHDESLDVNMLLGGLVEQEGRETWQLVVLCDSPKRDGGIRGKRGAYAVSKLIVENIDGWQVIDGCPIRVDRRSRYNARNEQGELLPISGYVIDISHPVVVN